MKKQITFFFFLILCVSSRSQNTVTTDGPCTESMTMKAKGRWIKTSNEGPSQWKEVLVAVHNLMLTIYPQPTGVDAKWGISEGISYFGAKQRTSTSRDGEFRYESTDLPHFRKYQYGCGFPPYRCDDGKTQSMSPNEFYSYGISITANESGPAISVADQSWTINELPVKLRNPVLKTIRGFELQHGGTGGNFRCMLVHRKDILPYVPITRKQYLERCIFYHTKLWDEQIGRIENLPVRSLEEQENEKKAKLAKFEKDFGKDPKRLKSAVDYYLSGYKTEQQIREEDVAKAKDNKARELKKFTDELERTTQQGLLDSPAMIRAMYLSDIVFEQDPVTSRMVVIENRDYVRKELSNNVPQLFVLSWEWGSWPPFEKIAEIMEKDFPFEKLQAMIDK